MKLGFIKPNFPNEKRVALLPCDIQDFENEIFIEDNFGEFLDISNREYEKAGCTIKGREEIFQECDEIFSLKLIQPVDYPHLRKNQMIFGWTHPFGSGKDFMQQQAIPKELIIVDLDNIFPNIFYQGEKIPIPFIATNFIWKNSFMAGYSSVFHALLSFGLVPKSTTKVAVLAAGSVSQGAYNAISKFNADIRLFYRKTMHEFKASLEEYDIIINGIEVDNPKNHIINADELKRIKKGCFLIDAAADAGNAIEGTEYTKIGNPIYKRDDKYFYVVNNAPSVFYRESSVHISKSFSKHIYRPDINRFYDLIENRGKV